MKTKTTLVCIAALLAGCGGGSDEAPGGGPSSTSTPRPAPCATPAANAAFGTRAAPHGTTGTGSPAFDVYPKRGRVGSELCVTANRPTFGDSSAIQIRDNPTFMTTVAPTLVSFQIPPDVSAGKQPLHVYLGNDVYTPVEVIVEPTIEAVYTEPDGDGQRVYVLGHNLGSKQGTRGFLEADGERVTPDVWSMHRVVARTKPGASVAKIGVSGESAERKARPVGFEVVYGFLDEGSVASADLILDDVWPVDRFEPIKLPNPLTFREDPYGEKYWRFIFYSLRPTTHLLYAWRKTGDVRYRDKLVEVLTRLAEVGLDSPYVNDKHASAYRAMVLTNAWAKLRRAGALDVKQDATIAKLVRTTAAFLADPANFEADYNHGFAESAALALVANHFPAFDDVSKHASLARDRLRTVLTGAVADDGVIYEQAAYYHYYVLDQIWQIAAWGRAGGVDLPNELRLRLDQMVRFATQIATPDGSVPLLGASIARNVRTSNAEVGGQIADAYPEYKYVVTGGKEGALPAERCTLFPVSGVSIMRSDWGDASTFKDQTHVVFDTGPYRTSHSDLDALAVHLYGAGKTVLSDGGLYSYEASPLQAYLRSTLAHNTVAIDGGSQQKGTASPVTQMSAGSCYQSGSHGLYPGVTHKRGVLMVEKDLVLVLDDLASATQHTYEQMWHPPPALATTVVDSGAVVRDSKGAAALAVVQAEAGWTARVARGETAPYDGWYSERYEVATPADSLHFAKTATSTTFATVLATGANASSPPTASVTRDAAGDPTVTIRLASGRTVTVAVKKLATPGETVTIE